MSSSFEALGMSLLGSSQMASPDPEKADSAALSARVLAEAVKNNLRPRDIITRKSIENAIAIVMATGGSTSAVLHYLAIASAAGVRWTIDDFERVRKKVPVLCALKPSGPYVATDFHAAGGVPQVLKMLLEAGLVHGECVTITGKTLAQELKDIPSTPRADQDVIRALDKPLYRQGHLAILHGNLAPEAYVGGTIALVREGDSITIDAKKRLIHLDISAKELAARRKKWKPPQPRHSKGLLAKYRKLVSTASEGAVTDANV